MSHRPDLILAANLRKARKHRQLSQEQLAAKAGVSDRTIGYLERPDSRMSGSGGPDSATPTLKVLLAVAEALGFDFWQLWVEGFNPAAPPHVIVEGLSGFTDELVVELKVRPGSEIRRVEQLIRVHLGLPPLHAPPGTRAQAPRRLDEGELVERRQGDRRSPVSVRSAMHDDDPETGMFPID